MSAPSPPPRPSPPIPEPGTRGAEARKEITDSAVSFLWEHAFREMTVARLMAGTSVSRSAFYLYFTDLHDLIETLLAELEATLHEAANPWILGEGEPKAALRVSLGGVIEICAQHGPILRAIVDAAPLDERLERTWANFIERWDDAVAARIEIQQKAGLVTYPNARGLAQALNRSDVATIVAEFGQRPQGDPSAVLNTLHHIWVGALYGGVEVRTPADDS